MKSSGEVWDDLARSNVGKVMRPKSALGWLPWKGKFDPLTGVVLHDQHNAMPMAAE